MHRSVFLVGILVILFSSVWCEGIRAEDDLSGELIDSGEYLLYLPETLPTDSRSPIIVAFSPGANASGLLESWKDSARNHRCALFCSKVVRNGMDVPPVLRRIAMEIRKLAEKWLIDPTAAIGVGVSGGGMTAHLFSFMHPEVVAAVISNVGYIHENSLKKVARYPRNKVCAFLTSPTDFNYKLMKEDRKFLDRLDWQTHWWEFEGGHRQAPPEVLDEAVEWVAENIRAAQAPDAESSSAPSPSPSSSPSSSPVSHTEHVADPSMGQSNQAETPAPGSPDASETGN